MAFTIDENLVTDQVLEELVDVGCCPWCVLRFTGVKDSTVYQNRAAVLKKSNTLPDKMDIKQSGDELPESKKFKSTPCVACLNILRIFGDTSFVDKIAEEVGSNREFSDFLISLNVPACLLIRQHSILLHLKSKFPKIYGEFTFSEILQVKDVWKCIVTDILAEKFKKPYNPNSAFEVSIVLEYSEDYSECVGFWKVLDERLGNAKKQRKLAEIGSKGAIEKAICETKQEYMQDLIHPPPPPMISCSEKQITCTHAPIFLAGRYNKYSRTLPQTPWMIDSERIVESSVQELMCSHITPYIKADNVKFTSSGREDVDVRTLGKGRPFALQFMNPIKINFTKDIIKKIQEEVNASTKDIAIRDLQVVTKDALIILKQGEESKKKTYACKCYTTKPINEKTLEKLVALRELVLDQKTPIRVLHRRPLAVRQRVIYSMSAKLLDPHHFQLCLTTQAGTYIKEFVHGDFGRTVPNVCDILGVETDILELDVESIDQDWPPPVDE